MTEARNTSGVDLARVALHQAREAAKARGEAGTRKTKRRTRSSSTRRDGREPTGFAALLQGLIADRAWELPAAGGSVLDRWPDIAAAVAPQLPHQVAAVGFHPETGQLDLRPASSAYATQLRLITARIVAAANESVGTEAVRTVRVLPPGAAPVPRTAPKAPAAAPDAPRAPVKTREMGSAGFHQALAAHQAVAPPSRVDPSIAAAIERQNASRGMREPEEDFGDGQAAIEELQAKAAREAAADSGRVRALRRARAERAGSAAAAASREARTA
ncbi:MULTISPECIES: DciA family protein [Streptomyces violaceusniger group]|uniref:Tra3-like protein n=2 Tax=Streptomyces rhizosphaericus TaxID=114699 RepID=A0ABN1S633_9ACTN|nr:MULTISPECIES: DciA family protein [Streptomyces violaceusniger group]